METKESFVNTPFVDDVMNNKKPLDYPQKFHYYGANTVPQHARNHKAMEVPSLGECMKG